MTTWAYIERVKRARKIRDKWVPIKPVYHRLTKGKDAGKYTVVTVNGVNAIATSIRPEEKNESI
jgi:hypothetical protein